MCVYERQQGESGISKVWRGVNDSMQRGGGSGGSGGRCWEGRHMWRGGDVATGKEGGR